MPRPVYGYVHIADENHRRFIADSSPLAMVSAGWVYSPEQLLQDICVRFVDGGRYASGRAFDVSVGGHLPSEEKPKRFVYTDTSGNEVPIVLRLDQVIAITGDPSGDQHQRGVGPAGPSPDHRLTPGFLNPAA